MSFIISFTEHFVHHGPSRLGRPAQCDGENTQHAALPHQSLSGSRTKPATRGGSTPAGASALLSVQAPGKHAYQSHEQYYRQHFPQRPLRPRRPSQLHAQAPLIQRHKRPSKNAVYPSRSPTSTTSAESSSARGPARSAGAGSTGPSASSSEGPPSRGTSRTGPPSTGRRPAPASGTG